MRRRDDMAGAAVALGCVALGCVALAACGDDPARVCAPPEEGASRVLLASEVSWALAEPEADPFATHRPGDDISCAEEARQVEDFGGRLTYGIDTLDCPYTTLVQPLLANTCAGDRLYVWLWNFRLTAPAEATAHLAVAIGGDVVWSEALPIPSDSGLIIEEVPLDRTYDAGAPIAFHVRNHGDNSYNLIELSAIRAE